MKISFTLLLSVIAFHVNAQVMCGEANENGTVTLTAPLGNVFTSIEFASYGTPNGSCGSYTIGACHAANSVSICEAAFIGENSASITASNGVFGDPCGGTVKRLYIQALYSASLPLTLLSFTARKIDADKIRLDWSSDHEINTSHFLVEKSTDGASFEEAGSVAAKGTGGFHYSFTNIISNNTPDYYYRLKMVDKDGKSQYSSIVHISSNMPVVKLSAFPNPASRSLTISGSLQQEIIITNTTGQIMKKTILTGYNQTVNIADWAPGVYFIKSKEGILKFIKE